MVQVLFIIFSCIPFDSSLIHIFAITYGSSLVRIFCTVRPSVRFSNNLKTTEANLMKLHRKVKCNEKACNAQELDPHVQIKAQLSWRLNWASYRVSAKQL